MHVIEKSCRFSEMVLEVVEIVQVCHFAIFFVAGLRVGHTMDVLSPFVPVLCHSDWLFHGESCLRLDVVHPGRAWPSSPACTWHCSLHSLSPLQKRGTKYHTISYTFKRITSLVSPYRSPSVLQAISFPLQQVRSHFHRSNTVETGIYSPCSKGPSAKYP